MLLLTGFEVMTQVPELQPTHRQYKYPAIAPTSKPMIVSKCFLIIFFKVLFFSISVGSCTNVYQKRSIFHRFFSFTVVCCCKYIFEYFKHTITVVR